MKAMRFAIALAAFSVLFGCTQDSKPGGPGVSNSPKGTTTSPSDPNPANPGAVRHPSEKRPSDPNPDAPGAAHSPP